jgi:hypothetical protein
MNGDWARMWKEPIVAYFRDYPAFAWRNRGNHEKKEQGKKGDKIR